MSHEVPQTFIPHKGFITPQKYREICENNGIEPTQTVLLFPGNPSHHTKFHTLFSHKSGGELAKLAGQLGDMGIPTLSLPTTGMDILDDEDPIPELAKQAVADIWKAIGFGMNILLPVRDHTDTKFFDNEFMKGVEPSFWGINAPTPNKNLAAYYLAQLTLMQKFLNGEEIQLSNEFIEAYHYGKEMRKKIDEEQSSDLDAWFIPKSTVKKESTKTKQSKPLIEEDSFSFGGSSDESSSEEVSRKKPKVEQKKQSVKLSGSTDMSEVRTKEVIKAVMQFTTGLDISLLPPEKQIELINITKLLGMSSPKVMPSKPIELSKRALMAKKLFEENFGLPKGGEKKGKIAFTLQSEGKKIINVKSISARGETEIGSDARHVTPISWVEKMLERYITDLKLDMDDAAKLLLYRIENLLTDIVVDSKDREIVEDRIFNRNTKKMLDEDAELGEDRFFANEGIMTKEEIIEVFHEYYRNYYVGEKSGETTRDVLAKMAEVLFRMYSRKTYVSFPTQGNTETLKGEGKKVAESGDLLYELHSKLSDEEELDEKSLNELVDILYMVFDFKALPEDDPARKEKREEVYRYLASKSGKVVSQLPQAYHEEFQKFVDEHPEIKKTTSKSAYNNAIANYWRLSQETDLALLPLLIARHLDDMFVLAPSLQEYYQQEIMQKFIDKVAEDYQMEEEESNELLINVKRILNNRYHYFYEFDLSNKLKVDEQAFITIDKPYAEYINELAHAAYDELVNGTYEDNRSLRRLLGDLAFGDEVGFDTHWDELIVDYDNTEDFIYDLANYNINKQLSVTFGDYLSLEEIQMLKTSSLEEIKTHDNPKLIRAAEFVAWMRVNERERLASLLVDEDETNHWEILKEEYLKNRRLAVITDQIVTKLESDMDNKKATVDYLSQFIYHYHHHEYTYDDALDEYINRYADLIAVMIYDKNMDPSKIPQVKGLKIDLGELFAEVSELFPPLTESEMDVGQLNEMKTKFADIMEDKLLALIKGKEVEATADAIYMHILETIDESELLEDYEYLLEQKADLYWNRYFIDHSPLTPENIKNIKLPKELAGLNFDELFSELSLLSESFMELEDEDPLETRIESATRNYIYRYLERNLTGETTLDKTKELYAFFAKSTYATIVKKPPQRALDDDTNIYNQRYDFQYQLQSHDINAVCEELFKDREDIYYLPAQKEVGDPNTTLADTVDTAIEALTEGKRVICLINVDLNHWATFMLAVSEDNNLVVYYKDSLGYQPSKHFERYVTDIQKSMELGLDVHIDRNREQVEHELFEDQSLVHCGVFGIENAEKLADLTKEDIEAGVEPEYFDPRLFNIEVQLEEAIEWNEGQIYNYNIELSRERFAKLYQQNTNFELDESDIFEFDEQAPQTNVELLLLLYKALPTFDGEKEQFDIGSLTEEQQVEMLNEIADHLANKLDSIIEKLSIQPKEEYPGSLCLYVEPNDADLRNQLIEKNISFEETEDAIILNPVDVLNFFQPERRFTSSQDSSPIGSPIDERVEEEPLEQKSRPIKKTKYEFGQQGSFVESEDMSRESKREAKVNLSKQNALKQQLKDEAKKESELSQGKTTLNHTSSKWREKKLKLEKPSHSKHQEFDRERFAESVKNCESLKELQQLFESLDPEQRLPSDIAISAKIMVMALQKLSDGDEVPLNAFPRALGIRDKVSELTKDHSVKYHF